MIETVSGKLSRRERRAKEKLVQKILRRLAKEIVRGKKHIRPELLNGLKAAVTAFVDRLLRSQRATALLRQWKHRITGTATIGSLLLALNGSPLLAETGFVNEDGPWENTTSISGGNPTFADVDGDGDLDAFIGFQGTVKYYRNDAGTLSEQAAANPLNGVDFGDYAIPAFADLDGDGDLDAFIGGDYGRIKYYRNDAGTFSEQAAANPLNGVYLGDAAAPTFADIDGDGDLDAFFGEHFGTITYFRNDDGTFSEQAAANPLNDVDVGYYSAPTFADLDGDGDLDAFIGEGLGTVKYYRNDAGTFSEQADDNPFSGLDVGFNADLAFADLDGDGNLDAFIAGTGGLKYYTTANAPTDINLSGSSLDDNLVSGTMVGTLSATGADGGDTLTFTLVAGTGDSDNSSFSISGDTLYTAAVLSGGSKSVRIQVTDDSGGY
ncbi:MAG: cadherin repeat domain-containing protein, partial [Proteobacteria bacterium]|nr:cadherin repeat domain-containing protein [Pseudomonadota bacterium]